MYKIYAIILMILSPIVSADSFTVEATGGRYYLSIGSVDLENYYNQLYKAQAAAINKGLECGCKVKIKMPDVTVTVTRVPDQPLSYGVHLEWQTPATNVDASVLSPNEIRGYVVRYGDTTVLTHSTQTSYELIGLAAGDWEFYLATIDVYSGQSDWSEAIPVSLR